MRKHINVEELKKVFRIKDGHLERMNPHCGGGSWTIVKNNGNSHGYCQVGFNGRLIFYHHIIWILSTGKNVPQGLYIDHINGDRTDSRMDNMRLVTGRGNAQNRKEHRAGALAGCVFDKNRNKYSTKIYIHKTINLGRYDTEIEAHRVYNIACRLIDSYTDTKSFKEIIREELRRTT